MIGTNLLVSMWGFTDIETAARRAGDVAMVNMTVFYLGTHLSFQADCLRISLSTMRSIHRGITSSFVVMTVFHVAALKPTESSLTKGINKQFYGVLVRRRCYAHR